MALVVWFIATTTAHAQCVDQPTRITEVESAVLEGRDADALKAVSRLLESFGCGPLANAETLARMWLAQAVLFDNSGETLAANDALLAAAELSPATWVDGYGLAMRVRQLRLMARESLDDRPKGNVEIEPVGYVTGIDGTRYDRFPARIPAGLHLVQVGPSVNEMKHAELVDVLPETDLVVVTNLPPPRRSLTLEARRRRRFFTGAAFAGGALAAYALTAATNAGFDNNPRRSVAIVNNSLVVASAGLLATSGTFFVYGGTTGRRAR
ncbi:MAG: hypothetical protein AAGA48_01145 [Myxococcota bacterium]